MEGITWYFTWTLFNILFELLKELFLQIPLPTNSLVLNGMSLVQDKRNSFTQGLVLQNTNEEKTHKTCYLSDIAKSYQNEQSDLPFSLSVPSKRNFKRKNVEFIWHSETFFRRHCWHVRIVVHWKNTKTMFTALILEDVIEKWLQTQLIKTKSYGTKEELHKAFWNNK